MAGRAAKTHEFDLVMPVLHHKTVKRSYDRDCTAPLHLMSLAPDVLVTAKSPVSIKNAAYTIAEYFRREFRYDFTGYSVEDTDDYHVYLWTQEHFFSDKYDQVVIGACLFDFNNRVKNDDGSIVENVPALGWCWLHPYLRRRGILSKAWPYFIARYKSFFVTYPRSAAMSAFMEKKGETWHGNTVADLRDT